MIGIKDQKLCLIVVWIQYSSIHV